MNTAEKSQKYKERVSQQRKKEYQESREKARQKQYDIQAQSTKQQWNSNQEKSDQWLKKEYHKPFWYKVKKFFGQFHRDPKPEDGLFTKKEKNMHKKNIFQKIFKRDKKKKKT